MNLNLNIISLNIPYPPDYGGMIDSFYRIKSLHDQGIRIHLHCFEYGRERSKELESICESVNYYKRGSGIIHQFSILPSIVSSRRSRRLIQNLSNNDYPILFDGLHTTYYLNHPSLFSRIKMVRLHNIEHQYYGTLSATETNLIKKLYFRFESVKLKFFEKILHKANFILPISESDQKYFKERYNNSVLIPPFHQFDRCESLSGFGEYILYHGDLSVSENELISELLITDVFSKITFPCIIAGKNPSDKLLNKASCFPNIQIFANPDKNEMFNIIRNAHINILPALASNGFKIKLLIALFSGRHCLINSIIANETVIKSISELADSGEELIDQIQILMQKPFTEEMINSRQKALSESYNNEINARRLIKLFCNQY